ncbi:MAG: class I SAM-dependent methyltransferase [Leptospiraceae bacterium]|nr:class I SAM-dependent methyltransferase [Leptospiraceae bacterium]MCP5494499.1 class I SAM-dependent methyltransferase [Leptospiraceae bacterium]
MELIRCNHCEGRLFARLYSKQGSDGIDYTLARCSNCKLVQVNPQPSAEEVAKCYESSYFTQRTDRGYDNYYSDSIKKEITRVFTLNLEDLEFFPWEATLPDSKSTLDIGCAAGYFVDFMDKRGWMAVGIDIAKEPIHFAKNTLGVIAVCGDFLTWDKEIKNKYELITLWASLEHLHKPKETLEKIYRHLKPNGRLILSTCRYGSLAKVLRKRWRYMNVPEHLYFYSLDLLIEQCQEIGFKNISYITYGSGFTAKKNASKLYKTAKRFMDGFVKVLDQGDMMVLSLEKS